MQNKEQCRLDPVVRARKPSYPGQDAWVIGRYTCRENQELLSTLTERKDKEIIGSICNWKTPKVTKANKLLEMALESTLVDVSTGKRSTELKL